jgi:hypothetical protein
MMHGAVCLEVEMESPSWNLVSSSPSFPGKLTGGWVSIQAVTPWVCGCAGCAQDADL